MMTTKVPKSYIIAGIGIIIFMVVVGSILAPSKKPVFAPALPPAVSKRPVVNVTTPFNPKDAYTNNQFDAQKFNQLYNDVKAKKQRTSEEQEKKQLQMLEEENKRAMNIKNATVYDVIIDYEKNVRGIIVDVINGADWKNESDRVMYFGATLVLVSAIGLVLQSV